MKPADRDPRRLVFVGGLHRSGTTPLTRAMAEHPDISGLSDTGVKEDEGQHLQSVYPRARDYGGAGRFALDDRAHLTESSPLVGAASADRLWEAWSPYWDLDRSLLVEKSPPNLVMGRYLQAVFPGARMVVVMRHPVSVALATVKWRRLLSRNFQNHTSLDVMIENWVRGHETFMDDLPRLEDVVVLRYEELVKDPEVQLRPVQHLLGLEEPIPHTSLRSSHSSGYEQRWNDMSGTVLGRRRRRRIEERFGESVARFGYDLSDLSALGPLHLPART